MRVINLTPHEIVLRTQDCEKVFEPSGQVARVETRQSQILSRPDFPMMLTETMGVSGLPEPENNTIFIASSIVAQAAQRSDVVSPDTGATAIRENGQIVAVTRFQTFTQSRLCEVGHLLAQGDYDLDRPASLTDAYFGKYPGVDRQSLLSLRVANHAEVQGRSVEDVKKEIFNAGRALSHAPCVEIGGERVADMRGQHVSLPILREAAAMKGIPFIANVCDETGREMLILQSATTDVVEDFLSRWADSQGLVRLYGDPARGFAEGYMTRECGVCAHSTGQLDGETCRHCGGTGRVE